MPQGLDRGASVGKTLFLGRLLEQNVFPYPAIPAAEAETLRMVVDSIDGLLSPRAADFVEHDKAGAQPEEFIQQLRELGLFGLIIPEEFGGIGFSNRAYARAVEQVSRHDGSTCLTVAAHSSIGMKGILLFGTDEQKAAYLPKLATGEYIAAFCLTEPGAGSDAASIKTSATKNADGSWTLSGEKIWITNGAFADVFTVFARTESEAGKITAFIVERAWGGVESGPKENKMGIRASATTAVRFDNVRVPANRVLLEEGKGFKVAMTILNNGRTGLGGGTVGGMKTCLALATRYANQRKQFGKPIGEFGLVREKIARMTVNCFVTESIVGLVGNYIDSGVEDYSVEAAMTKIFASEALWQSANDALQIAGGNGFMKEFPYERIVRDSRINLIFEGTNEILRLYVALSGLKLAGEYLKEIGRGAASLLNDPIKGFGLLSGYAQKRFSEITSIGRERLEFVHPTLRAEAEVFERGASLLSRAANGLLKRHGKDVVNLQFPQKRLADSAIDLFAGVAVLSRVSTMIRDRGADQCANEISLAKIFARDAHTRLQENLGAGVERPEDAQVESLAAAILAHEGYLWDVL